MFFTKELIKEFPKSYMFISSEPMEPNRRVLLASRHRFLYLICASIFKESDKIVSVKIELL